jgi:serine/threonine protein kinase
MLSAGTRLGPYEILSPLGAGGMGEVYKARDIRLDRWVALKVLPADMASDPDRLRRFEQEARAASALNHPNILSVHDVGSVNSISYIIMELVEGKTLRDLLVPGPLPLKKLLDLAVQIAEGLASAHEAGIVHRDLKPANIMVSRDGFAKILDFGLAKVPAVAGGLGSGVDGDASTETASETGPGAIAGTVAYMSPEQASGKRIDFRSDQFSFGSILYEMATGRCPFRCETTVDTLAAILHDEPEPIVGDASRIPAPLWWILERCLSKNSTDRFVSTRDLARDLARIRQHVSETKAIYAHPRQPLQTTSSRRRLLLLMLIVGAALVVSLLAAIKMRSGSSDRPRAIRLQILPPPNTTFDLDSSSPSPVALAPNGTQLVFGARDSSGKSFLWLRRLADLEAGQLPGTEGAAYPFWSPDSRSIGFFAGDELKRVDAAGGPVQRLCNAAASRGGTWNRNGVILFASGVLGAIYRVGASGGEPIRVTEPKEGGPRPPHRWPFFLPDDHHFLFSAHGQTVSASDQNIYLGSLESPSSRLVLHDAANMAYSAGHLLFARGDMLMTAGFDTRAFRVTSEPAPVLQQIFSHPYTRHAAFTASASGAMAYQPLNAADVSEVIWVDRSGKRVSTVAPPADYGGIRLSPDGQKLAVEVRDPRSRNTDVWVYDLNRGSATRLTAGAPMNDSPVWSPDGRRLVFASLRRSLWDLYEVSTEDFHEKQLALLPGVNKAPTDWSLDGRFIAFMTTEQEANRYALWRLSTSDNSVAPILKSAFSQWGAQFAPDGQWLAYEAADSGIGEVYVCSFPAATRRRQVSSGGGSQVRWRRDGKELFFVDGHGRMMAASVAAAGEIEIGRAEALFQAGLRPTATDIGLYGVAADGQRFVLNRVVEGHAGPSIVVVLDWRRPGL